MKKENYYLEFHKKVGDDLLEIQNYIIDNFYDINAADRITNKLIKAFGDIVYSPESYQIIDNDQLANDMVRIKKIIKYNIYYQIKSDTVVILLVSSNRRSITNIFNELLSRI